MSVLGLNEHHQATLMNYMRFARYQRGQRMRAVDSCFEELKDSRLVEDTFTVDEVTEMLDGLLSVVHVEVESELINTTHTNILLLRQVFQQAEKWHLKLQADISELENRELLERIKDFEEAEFSGTKRESDFKPLPSSKLDPLNESGGAQLLQMEISRLEEENQKLQDKVKSLEGQFVGDKNSLREELERTKAELAKAKSFKPDTSSEEVEELRRELKVLQIKVAETETKSKSREGNMEQDLTGTKHELLRVQEMLEMAEKELEKKVSRTAPYQNLKKMMQKKNEQLKDLRKRLNKYEPADE